MQIGSIDSLLASFNENLENFDSLPVAISLSYTISIKNGWLLLNTSFYLCVLSTMHNFEVLNISKKLENISLFISFRSFHLKYIYIYKYVFKLCITLQKIVGSRIHILLKFLEFTRIKHSYFVALLQKTVLCSYYFRTTSSYW